MKRVFKKYFVPHEHNGYKPHFFRFRSIVLTSLFVVAVFCLSLAQTVMISRLQYLSAVLPGVLVDLANQDRDLYDLPPLTRNSLLDAAAQEKANDMVRYSYFAHVSPTGIAPWYWFTKAGYRFIYAGENLAINFRDSEIVNQAWMDSPGHRANILNGNFSEVGIATAEGLYEGAPTIFVVQMFGRPIAPEPAVTPAPVASVAHAEVVAPVPGEEKVVPVVETATGGTSTFIAVKNTEAKPTPTIVVGAPTSTNESETLGTTQYSSVPERFFSSPRLGMRIVYAVVTIAVLLSILLSLGIEFKRHHAKHVVSGLFVLILVIGLTYLYQYLSASSLAIL